MQTNRKGKGSNDEEVYQRWGLSRILFAPRKRQKRSKIKKKSKKKSKKTKVEKEEKKKVALCINRVVGCLNAKDTLREIDASYDFSSNHTCSTIDPIEFAETYGISSMLYRRIRYFTKVERTKIR